MTTLNEVCVLWFGNNDATHDGRTAVIERSMIKTPSENGKLIPGSIIMTKPWDKKCYQGIVMHSELVTPVESTPKYGKQQAKRKASEEARVIFPSCGKTNVKKTMLGHHVDALQSSDSDQSSSMPPLSASPILLQENEAAVDNGLDETDIEPLEQIPIVEQYGSPERKKKTTADCMPKLPERRIDNSCSPAGVVVNQETIRKSPCVETRSENRQFETFKFDDSFTVTPSKDMKSFRIERKKAEKLNILRTISATLSAIKKQNVRLYEQNEKIIGLLSFRATSKPDDNPINFHRPLMSEEEVIHNPKWQASKYLNDTQLFACELVKDLASLVFFGDDVLLNSNVLKSDLSKNRTSWSPKKLKSIKSLLCRELSNLSMADFDYCWEQSLRSLQDRCKNLRKGAVRMATSSELITSINID